MSVEYFEVFEKYYAGSIYSYKDNTYSTLFWDAGNTFPKPTETQINDYITQLSQEQTIIVNSFETVVKINDETSTTSKTTGALIVAGGVGISGNVHATHANFEDVEADSINTSGTITATGFSGDGPALSNLNASNVSTGLLSTALGGTGETSLSNVTVGAATQLETARTINNVSFNGTSDITITASTPSSLTAGADLSGSNFNGGSPVTFDVESASANLVNKIVKRDANGNFEAETITANGFSGGGSALSGLNASNVSTGLLSTALGGTGETSLSNVTVGAATNASNVILTVDSDTTASTSIPFSTGTNGSQELKTRGNLTFTPSTGTVTATAFSGGSINVSDTTSTTSKATGALIVAGGLGVIGNIYATHVNFEDVEANTINITSTTVSTSTATGALKVAGGLGVSGALYGSNVYVSSNLTVGTDTFHVDADTSNVGIGKTDPERTLDVAGDIQFSGDLYQGGSLYQSSQWITSGGDIYYDGKVGINTTTPGANLHVEGNVYVSSNLTVDTNTLFVDATNDSVGINTSTPGANLHVEGNVYVSSNLTVNTDTLHVDAETNRVGINTSTPGANLHVEGNVYVSSNVVIGSNIFVNGIADPTNNYLPMVDTDGKFIQSPVYVTPGGKYVISASEAEFLGNISLGGNTTIVSSTSVVIEDRIFGIGANNSSTNLDTGIMFEHREGELGEFANIAIIYHSSDHELIIGYTQNTFSDDHILSYQDADHVMKVIIDGNLQVQNTLSVTGTSTFNSNIYVADRLGVGTSEPGYDLDVHGTSNVGVLTADSINVSDATSTTSNTSGALIVTGGVGIGGNIHATHANFEDVEANTINITGTTVSTSKGTGALKVAGGLGVSGALYGSNAFLEGDFTVDTNTLFVNATNDSVGINTSTPNANLHVVGNVYVSSDLTVGTDTLHVDASTSNVGIGKTEPERTLDVAGDIQFSGDLYKNDSLYQSSQWITSGDDIYYNLGDVGIGHTQPTANLHVVGNAYVSSNLTVDTDTLHVDTQSDRVGVNTATPEANLHVVGNVLVTGDLTVNSNIYVTDGLITNTNGVMKKTYSFTDAYGASYSPGNGKIKVVFNDRIFQARITIILEHGSAGQLSTITADVSGGRRSGGGLTISKGPISIYGTTDNPWTTNVVVDATSAEFEYTNTLANNSYYHVFIEYMSPQDTGKVLRIVRGGETGDITKTFTY